MIQKFFTLIVVILLSTLTFSSCSSDDDEGGSNGSFTIDGESYRVELASCTDGTQEEYADAGCFFEAMLRGSEDTYYFTVELVGKYNLNNLKSGEDVSDIASVYSFHRISNVDFSRFEDLSFIKTYQMNQNRLHLYQWRKVYLFLQKILEHMESQLTEQFFLQG